MMNDKIKKLFAAMRKETLTGSERSYIRSVLLHRISEGPHRYGGFRIANFLQTYSRRFAFACAVLIVVSAGGVSVAAERSLPGNPLYAIKIHVTEPLLKKLALSEKSKTLLEASFAERRLNEVTTLKAEGNLKQETQKVLLNTAAKHTEQFIEKVNDLPVGLDVVEKSSRLEAALRAHEKILEGERKKEQDAATSTESIQKLKKSAETVSKVRIRGEKKIQEESPDKLKKTSEKKLKNASDAYKRAREKLERKKDELPAEASDTAKDVLDKAKDALDAGEDELKTGKYENTIPRLLEAQRESQEATIIIDATSGVNADGAKKRNRNREVSDDEERNENNNIPLPGQ